MSASHINPSTSLTSAPKIRISAAAFPCLTNDTSHDEVDLFLSKALGTAKTEHAEEIKVYRGRRRQETWRETPSFR